MNKLIKSIVRRCSRKERGQALIMVLVLLMLGSLVLPPSLSHISTTLQTRRVYQDKTDELYAADSGIEDAIWQIKYDRLQVLFDDPVYDVYDYDSAWSYNLDDQINRLTTNVTIQNVWIPKDITPLDPSVARTMIESNKLMVAGTTEGETGYKIKINFTPAEDEEEDLIIESIGIWLPLGFTYVTHSSNLEVDEEDEYYSEPEIEPYLGGWAVVWNFDSVPFTSFPGVSTEDAPMTTEITFNYTPATPGNSPVAIAWMTTSGVSDVPLSWDIDTRIHKIVSVVGDTNIEAFAAKCELRKMGAAIAGDYRAVGNSLMIDQYHDSYDIRDTLLAESFAEVTNIPESADVVAAYLYWAGWFAESTTEPVWTDDCADFGDWISGSCWNINSGHFRSHYSSGVESTRYNTWKNSLDLSSYPSGRARVSWQHWEEGSLEYDDALRFQFSGDGGLTWSDMITAFSNDIGSSPHDFSYTIPDEYLTNNFMFRFYLQNFGGDEEYAYVDNFAVSELIFTPDTSVVFEINGTQVYLDASGNPQDGEEELTAGESEVLDSGSPGQYSYACHRDVTKLVKTYSDEGDDENHTGNGDYTVGGVDASTGEQLSYAGWSLLIIYSSPETAGHQLYLYDTFAYAYDYQYLDFDFDGQPGGTITGFFVPDPIQGEVDAARLTCFVGEGDDFITDDYLEFNDTRLSDGYGTNNVWNSQSVGMSEDGVDIDTFHVTWASGLLESGDTTADIGMYTSQDNWNLIYIILSMRSETVTGGTTHYVIHSQ